MTMADSKRADQHAGPGLEAPRRRTHAIPVRRRALIDALASEAHPDHDAQGFRTLCNFLGAYFHHAFYDRLTRLKDLHARLSQAGEDENLAPLGMEIEAGLVDILSRGNFEELDTQDLARNASTLPHLDVQTRTPHHLYETARIFHRGLHQQQRQQRRLLARREWQEDVFEDVVIFVRFRKAPRRTTHGELLGHLEQGRILIKSFRNVSRHELPMLLPGVEVVMSRKDALLIGGPALLGGIPVALNIVPALSVMLVFAGALLGISGTVQQDTLMKAMGALSALVGAGAFMFRQYASYSFRKLRYQKRLADNVYYRNVNNDAGVLDTLIGAAEDQEIKEVILAYHAMLVHGPAASNAELDRRIEAWLEKSFGISVDFEVDDALDKLRQLGFLSDAGGRLAVPGLPAALAALDTLWDRLYEFADRPLPVAP